MAVLVVAGCARSAPHTVLPSPSTTESVVTTASTSTPTPTPTIAITTSTSIPSTTPGPSPTTPPTSQGPPASPSTAATGRPLGTYTDWQWPPTASGAAYTAQELDLTVVTDPGPGTPFFFAHQVAFEGGSGAYLGLQTLARTGPRPDSPAGKVAIFSVFSGCDDNAPTAACTDLIRRLLGAGGAQAIPGNGSFCAPLTDPRGNAPEGPGAGCLVALNWQAGTTYRLRITSLGSHVWLGSVIDTTIGSVTEIGQIRVPDPWGGLRADSVSWIEYYGNTDKLATCRQLPQATARWEAGSGLQVVTGLGLLGLGTSSASVRPTGIHNHLAVGPGLCPNSSIIDLTPPALGAVQTMGGAAQP